MENKEKIYEKVSIIRINNKFISSIIAGCSDDKTTSAKVEEDKVLQYQGTPGAVGFPELAEDLGYLGDLS